MMAFLAIGCTVAAVFVLSRSVVDLAVHVLGRQRDQAVSGRLRDLSGLFLFLDARQLELVWGSLILGGAGAGFFIGVVPPASCRRAG